MSACAIQVEPSKLDSSALHAAPMMAMEMRIARLAKSMAYMYGLYFISQVIKYLFILSLNYFYSY